MSKKSKEEVWEEVKNDFPDGIVITYENFMRFAKSIFTIAKNDEMLDMNSKKLVKQDLLYGLFLTMKDGEEYIGVKVMVGSKEQIKEAFENGNS